MLSLLKMLVWISFGLLVLVYFGYPLAILVVAKMKSNGREPEVHFFEPKVSMIVPARNEERVIEKKIENTLELDYPKDKLEIIVVSDNSTDRTEQIVKKYCAEGVRLIVLPEQQGKTEAQNIAVGESSGEVLIFSDANAMYEPDAVRCLVNHFQDPEVGCVSGALHYANPQESVVGREENLYWLYERFIKIQEDRVGSILGANGSIYAVRQSDYVPLERDMASDFIEPLEIAARGKKVVYEAKAVSYEDATLCFDEEFARRRRIVSRSVHSVVVHRQLLNPFRNGILAFELIFHKGLRWLSPFFMMFLFVASGVSVLHGFYHTIFYSQLGFYGLCVLGHVLRSYKKLPAWIFVPYYFCLLGYASFLGVVDFLRGKRAILWEPIRS